MPRAHSSDAPRGKYANFEELREQAVTLRRSGLSLRQIREELQVHNKTTLKKHNPKTVRKNTGETYRGCLAVKVLKSADLYRRIEGSWYGIVLGATHQQG
jgi:hypothetical protein